MISVAFLHHRMDDPVTLPPPLPVSPSTPFSFRVHQLQFKPSNPDYGKAFEVCERPGFLFKKKRGAERKGCDFAVVCRREHLRDGRCRAFGYIRGNQFFFAEGRSGHNHQPEQMMKIQVRQAIRNKMKTSNEPLHRIARDIRSQAANEAEADGLFDEFLLEVPRSAGIARGELLGEVTMG